MAIREKNLPKVSTQVKKLSINPVAALLIYPTILALVLMAGAMLWNPAAYYTHSRQLQFMFGLGLLWLLCTCLVEKGNGN